MMRIEGQDITILSSFKILGYNGSSQRADKCLIDIPLE
jgi:hypothetical protein